MDKYKALQVICLYKDSKTVWTDGIFHRYEE
jgi:hypothetical protein